MNYLEKMNLVHGNINTDNILIVSEIVEKKNEFGFTIFFNKRKLKFINLQGFDLPYKKN